MFLEEKKEGEARVDPKRLENLIAWLETKDPQEAYRFVDCDKCLFAQYLRESGFVGRMGFETDGGDAWQHLHRRFFHVAGVSPQTFGAALERARSNPVLAGMPVLHWLGRGPL